MERAILKTLIYGDIFDYPLKVYEIHKWLIGRKSTLRQVESALARLTQNLKLKTKNGYYFLPKRTGLVVKRRTREKQSVKYFKKAQLLAPILKLIPWIKLVGISGGLAMDNAGKKDDIDLFVITSKNRLWICRLLALFILELTGPRRKANYTPRQAAGKICLNILLEEDRLQQSKKNLYTAHEVLQMKILWQRDGIYSKYLSDNEWVFKYLPNWTSQVQNSEFRIQNYKTKFKIFDAIENIAKKIQLKIMQKPQGQERIEDGAVYFHPKDHGEEVLKKYLAGLDI